MNDINNKILAVVGIVGMLVLGGCGTPVKNLDKKNQKLEVSDNKSIVFGKVDSNFKRRTYVWLKFQNIADKKTYRVGMSDTLFDDKDKKDLGKFLIELPPGDYQIVDLQVDDDNNLIGMRIDDGISSWHLDPNISFSVPPRSVVYIGNIVCRKTDEDYYVVVKHGEFKIWVSDDREKQMKEFREDHPNFKGDIKVRLMKMTEKKEETKKEKQEPKTQNNKKKGAS